MPQYCHFCVILPLFLWQILLVFATTIYKSDSILHVQSYILWHSSYKFSKLVSILFSFSGITHFLHFTFRVLAVV